MLVAVLTLLRLIFLAFLLRFFVRIVRLCWREVDAASQLAAGPDERQPAPATVEVEPQRWARLRLLKSKDECEVFTTSTGYRLTLNDDFDFAGEASLGRAEENDLVFKDAYVSAKHARVYAEGPVWWLEDRGSKNGTILNGRRVKGKRRLHTGDQITVGSSSFRFVG